MKQLDEISATRLFEAASLLDPESPAPLIGLGYIYLNKLELTRAKEVFEAVLEQEPDHHLAQAFLGICHLLKKSTRKKGEELIDKIKSETDDPTIINLCKIAHEWSTKDLKSAKAPFFQKKEE